MRRWAVPSATIGGFVTTGLGSQQRLGVALATTSVAGALSAADYARFTTFPAARVYNSTQLIVASATTTVLTYNSERYDTHGFHSTSSNTGRLTVPAGLGGMYLVGGAWQWDANAGGTRRAFGLRLNGTLVIAAVEEAPSGATMFPTFAPATLVALAAGDYVDSTGYQDAGGNLAVVATGASSPEYWLVRLGS
jgi:hypothetical protein